MTGVRLGAVFEPLPSPGPIMPSPDELLTSRLDLVLAALTELRGALSALPVPQVHLEPPDLSAVVNAVNGLKPSVTAEEIAAAVREALTPTLPPPAADDSGWQTELLSALAKLDFRLQGTRSSGGGMVGDIGDRADRLLGQTSEMRLDTHYDWQAAGGASVPLYVGTALPGTATSAASWRVEKYTYITGPAGDAVPSVVLTATGAWDSRASLFP